MSLDINRLSRVRPFLYHLTSEKNVESIRNTMVLRSAVHFLPPQASRSKRFSHVLVPTGTTSVHIRDQAPLYEGNTTLQGGWSFADLIYCLNEKVFFWPGNSIAPIQYGRNHFARYAHEKPAILRAPTSDIIALNGIDRLRFCRYNSGAPRCNNGVGSPRGPKTFSPAAECTFGVGDVKEVTFNDCAKLPLSTQVSDVDLSNWSALREE